MTMSQLRTNKPSPPSGGVNAARAVVLLVVAVLLGVVLLGRVNSKGGPGLDQASSAAKPHSAAATTTLKPSATTSTTAALVPPAQVKLQVLNGVGYGSLAGEWSTKLRANFGYDTLPPDNATATVRASVIYVITPGYLPEADALAEAVGKTPAIVDTTVPAPTSAPIPPLERANANLVLVIGPDLVASA